MGSIKELEALFRPTGGPYQWDWSTTESRLGRPVPDDYKQLVAVFGSAKFCQGIALYVPDPNPLLDLASATASNLTYLTDDTPPDERPEHTPDGKSFDPAALISWGQAPGGDYFLWYPDPDAPSDPDRYTIVLTPADQADWWFFAGETSDFLYRWVTGVEPAEGDYFHVTEFIDDGPPFVDVYDPPGAPQPIRFTAH
ncbi:hypothetical protein ACWDXV_16575 [Nocardia nova]